MRRAASDVHAGEVPSEWPNKVKEPVPCNTADTLNQPHATHLRSMNMALSHDPLGGGVIGVNKDSSRQGCLLHFPSFSHNLATHHGSPGGVVPRSGAHCRQLASDISGLRHSDELQAQGLQRASLGQLLGFASQSRVALKQMPHVVCRNQSKIWYEAEGTIEFKDVLLMSIC